MCRAFCVHSSRRRAHGVAVGVDVFNQAALPAAGRLRWLGDAREWYQRRSGLLQLRRIERPHTTPADLLSH
jgi:hypothetical protein